MTHPPVAHLLHPSDDVCVGYASIPANAGDDSLLRERKRIITTMRQRFDPLVQRFPCLAETLSISYRLGDSPIRAALRVSPTSLIRPAPTMPVWATSSSNTHMHHISTLWFSRSRCSRMRRGTTGSADNVQCAEVRQSVRNSEIAAF